MTLASNLEVLYSTERERLFTYALSIVGDEGCSEDIVHDVFGKLCEKPLEAEDLRAYVYRCVRNRALDILRKKSRTRGFLNSISYTSIYEMNGHAADQTMQHKERMLQVQEAMGTLQDGEREVMVLHLHSEMTFGEISKILETPMGTVASRYRRGISKLRKKLSEEA